MNKEQEHSRLIRLQTYCIVSAFGAKLEGGAKIRPEDLWQLPGDEKREQNKFVWGSPEEARELIKKIEKAHGIKLK